MVGIVHRLTHEVIFSADYALNLYIAVVTYNKA
jgi:hypothetical protein